MENCKWMERSPEMFGPPTAIENSRQFLLLRTDILQKTVIGCPCYYFSIFFSRGPFLESPGNSKGPKSNIEINI